MSKNKTAIFLMLVIFSALALFIFYKSTQGVKVLPSLSPLGKPVPKTLTIIAAGDTTCNFESESNLECQDDKVSALAERENPNFILILGDLQYGGGRIEDYYQYFAKTWGRLKDKLKPVAGNHEYETPNAAGYFSYFNNIPAYYSFDKDNWHFVAIDSNCWAIGGCNEGSPEYSWLETDLAKNTKPCILAYWHHPRFSSGYHGANTNMDPIWQLLAKNHTSIVLNGHDHHYERFGRQDGITEFIVGTGGRSLYPYVATEPNSEFKTSEHFGFLKLDLKDKNFQWEFHTLNNGVIDHGESTCTS